MQRKTWKWAAVGAFIAIMSIIVIPALGMVGQSDPHLVMDPVETGIAEQIYQSTIQITMIQRGVENRGNQGDQSYHDEEGPLVEKISHGLGTVVRLRGETLLISHDHWSWFTSSTAPDTVVFRDAAGSVLVEMSGADLLPLILYHDSGTFILRAPEKLADKISESAVMASIERVSPGDIVHVVHRSRTNEIQISILTAEIVDQEIVNGVPLVSLRSLNGQSIEPGDSGGGVWVNGQLVGNLWMTVREVRKGWWQLVPPEQNKTGLSLAAGLTDELIDLIETLLEIQSPPDLVEDGLS